MRRVTDDVCSQHIRRILLESIFPKFRIAEYFQVHVDDTIHKLTSAILGMFYHSAVFIRRLQAS